MTRLTRRGFLAGLIAAPAIVQAKNIYIPPRKLIRPDMAPVSTAISREALAEHLWPGIIEFFGMEYQPEDPITQTVRFTRGIERAAFARCQAIPLTQGD